MLVFKKIRELGLKDKNIIQINTDSISYYGELPNGLDPIKFSGWKSSIFKELGDVNDFYDDKCDLSAKNIINTNERKRILHMKYAGSGKTTYIIELAKKYTNENKSYIVITPTHKTLDAIRKKRINCEIMQKYVVYSLVRVLLVVLRRNKFADHRWCCAGYSSAGRVPFADASLRWVHEERQD